MWSADAQPDGYPDKIVEKFGLTVSDEVTAVENGQADEVFDGDVDPGRPAERAQQREVRQTRCTSTR